MLPSAAGLARGGPGRCRPGRRAPRPPVLRGDPLARLVHGVLGGLLLAGVAAQGSPGLAAVLLATLVPFGLIISLVVRSRIRRRLGTARAAHPGAVDAAIATLRGAADGCGGGDERA